MMRFKRSAIAVAVLTSVSNTSALADTSKSMQLLQGYMPLATPPSSMQLLQQSLPLAGSGPVAPRAADAPYTPPSANLGRPGTVAIHQHKVPAQAAGKTDSKSRELLKQYLPLADTTAVHHSKARTLSYPVWVNQANPQNAVLYHSTVTREQAFHPGQAKIPLVPSWDASRKDTSLTKSWNLLGNYLPLAKGQPVPVAKANDVITSGTPAGWFTSAKPGIMKPSWVANDFGKSYFYPRYSGATNRTVETIKEHPYITAGVAATVVGGIAFAAYKYAAYSSAAYLLKFHQEGVIRRDYNTQLIFNGDPNAYSAVSKGRDTSFAIYDLFRPVYLNPELKAYQPLELNGDAAFEIISKRIGVSNPVEWIYETDPHQVYTFLTQQDLLPTSSVFFPPSP